MWPWRGFGVGEEARTGGYCQRGAQVEVLGRHMCPYVAVYGEWMDKEEEL